MDTRSRRTMLPFRSLRSRIVLFFVLLMMAVQIGGIALTANVGDTIARTSIADELVGGERIFERLLADDGAQLLQGARGLAADAAFREAVATADRDALAAALRDHRARLGGDVMLLVDSQRSLLAGAARTDAADAALLAASLPLGESVDAVLRERGVWQLVPVGDRLHHLVVVPVLAPVPVAWVVLGRVVDDRSAQELRRLTGLHVSFASRDVAGGWRLHASTLGAEPRNAISALLAAADAERLAALQQGRAEAGGGLALLSSPEAGREHGVSAVLQKSIQDAIAPFASLRDRLLLFSLGALALSVIGGIAIAGAIARPLCALAATARRIAAGHYPQTPPLERDDEIGDLYRAFEHMRNEFATREARLLDLAYRDSLTGLPNRAMFIDRVRESLLARERLGMPLAVLALDLDRFKDVNDSLGKHWGDLLLQDVAARLSQVAAPRSGIVARMGGDEFAMLLPGADERAARDVAAEVQQALEPPANLEGHLVDARASVGIATCPAHAADVVALLRGADCAMQSAKRARSGLAIYDSGREQQAGVRSTLLSELRRAVERDELTVFYQPKILLADPRARHVEALLRWQHPARGFVAPDEFIPFAEQTGYIRAVTGWVLDRAIAQCAQWHHDGLAVHVSINVSARDLLNADFAERCFHAMRWHDCPPRLLRLEIAERALIDEPAVALENLRRLRELGVGLSIDDFGTGYSSFAQLRRLPVDELKIDRSFVLGMDDDGGSDAIVRSTIELGHNLGLRVVAEGVETPRSAQRLRELGCDFLQGFLFSRPLPPHQLERWWRESDQGAAGASPPTPSGVRTALPA